MSDELVQILGYVFFIVGLPLIVLGLAHLFLKRPVERLVDRLMGAVDARWKLSRTFRISSGDIPEEFSVGRFETLSPLLDEGEAGASGGAPLPPESKTGFEEAWQRIRSRFPLDPSRSVREAHVLLMDMLREGGGPAVLETRRELVATDFAGVARSMSTVLGTIDETKETARTMERVLAGKAVDREALDEAMVYYSARIDRLLER